MSEVVIRVENLAKRYRIGERERYVALRDVLARAASTPARLFRRRRAPSLNGDDSHIWALKDVSFEIRQGEVVGIIGRNGAGKSTLLKILARVTKPTRGCAEIRGRMGSLLEVGTGFHPELTGRENVFLSGAILGMSKAEIRRKFEEIAAFADVEKFIDTPLKHYSTGMQVRLAFSVAAHMEVEILIVDEVLAVGDAEFQKRCLGRMGDLAKGGCTVLFVSHDMRKLTTLCTRGVLLNAGSVVMEGKITSVASAYLGEGIMDKSQMDLSARGDRSGSGEARFTSIELFDGLQRTNTFEFGSELVQKIHVSVSEVAAAAFVQSIIVSADGVSVHELWNVNEGCLWKAEIGIHEFLIRVPELQLYPGTYSIDLWLGTRYMSGVDYIINVLQFHVVDAGKGSGQRILNRADGLVFQRAIWSSRRLPVVPAEATYNRAAPFKRPSSFGSDISYVG